MLMLLAAKLTSYQMASVSQWVMLKAEFSRWCNQEPDEVRLAVIKETKRRVILESQAYYRQQHIGRLRVTVCQSLIPLTMPSTEGYREDNSYFNTFSVQQIKEFSLAIGDQNRLHLTQKPVVQGLLLLSQWDQDSQPKTIQLKFRAPIYANDAIYLKTEQKTYYGYSQSQLCFEVRIN